MTTDYKMICERNKKKYGEEGAQIAGELASDLYREETHFIYELMQNAEDALGKRGENWSGSRKVEFNLSPKRLLLSHYGKPFDEKDVQSICDISKSTKDEASIGRFGIGFKSVFKISDRPEIHSGDEDFAIEDFLYPNGIERTNREDDETQIVLPLNHEYNLLDKTAFGLRKIELCDLLFLRHIDSIKYNSFDGEFGNYKREITEFIDKGIHHITLKGNLNGGEPVEQNWLIFFRDVFTPAQKKVGRVEIAFSLEIKDDKSKWRIKPITTSKISVFFPTDIESHLGFLIQGPYRSTRARDNLKNDDWNQYLIKETANTLVEALHWLCDKNKLDVLTLQSLPLVREKFRNTQFAPIFDAVHQALLTEGLLPQFNGGYTTAKQAKLPGAQELRDLFTSEQLSELLDTGGATWLPNDITSSKTPELHKYLKDELKIEEVNSEKLVKKMTAAFLEAQSDQWIMRLYEFFKDQFNTGLRNEILKTPFIRLADGTHTRYEQNKIFLPSETPTDFPTVRSAVFASEKSQGFLILIGISSPDPVDDVILNVLQNYSRDEIQVSNEEYAIHIKRIISAYKTDSQNQKDKLIDALSKIKFVKVVDAKEGKESFATPNETYIATQRLKNLYEGVPVLFVDDKLQCLTGEDVSNMFVACGASRHLATQKIKSTLTEDEKTEIRIKNGNVSKSGEEEPKDFTIRGLSDLIELLPTLNADEKWNKASLLWKSLVDLAKNKENSFFGEYKWFFGNGKNSEKNAPFDAFFVKNINQLAWVPNVNGELLPPSLVVFDNLGWEEHPFLQSKIKFKPNDLDQLAIKAGLNPVLIDLLRCLPPDKINSLVHELMGNNAEKHIETQKNINNTEHSQIKNESKFSHLHKSGVSSSHEERNDAQGGFIGYGKDEGTSNNKIGDRAVYSSNHAGGRPFISYVGVHPDEKDHNPDGINQEERMRIEEQAINWIINHEPTLQKTPAGNPGFDLYEADASGIFRWVEVKSMTGSMDDRDIGISYTQFECAQEKGSAFWLYIVEYANDPEKTRIIKIQNPVEFIKTFTFDSGWREIALVS